MTSTGEGAIHLICDTVHDDDLVRHWGSFHRRVINTSHRLQLLLTAACFIAAMWLFSSLVVKAILGCLGLGCALRLVLDGTLTTIRLKKHDPFYPGKTVRWVFTSRGIHCDTPDDRGRIYYAHVIRAYHDDRYLFLNLTDGSVIPISLPSDSQERQSLSQLLIHKADVQIREANPGVREQWRELEACRSQYLADKPRSRLSQFLARRKSGSEES